MRRADDGRPDGPKNVRDGIRVALDPAARECGPLVVFAGRIIAAGRAWKASRRGTDAFVDLGGDVGRVTRRGVRLQGARPVRQQRFTGRLDPHVGYVKAVPGASARQIMDAVGPETRGLVVEGLPGSGGLPAGMAVALRTVVDRIPVALAPRSPFGVLGPRVHGGTGEPLLELPLLSVGGLSGEQAWLLLMAALGDGTDRADTERRFAAYVAETSVRSDRRRCR